MSLQTIIDSAVSVEISRAKLVAQSVSRSGRILAVGRNWGNPWRFTIEPKPVWTWQDYRTLLEPVIAADKIETQTFQLGNVPGQTWALNYLGNAAVNSGTGALTGVTVTSHSGTTLVLNTSGASAGAQLLKIGDVIQYGSGYRYPYVVTGATNGGIVSGGSMTITTHRGYISQADYEPAGKSVVVGNNVVFYVKATKVPNIRLIPGKLAEFTDKFDFVEEIL